MVYRNFFFFLKCYFEANLHSAFSISKKDRRLGSQQGDLLHFQHGWLINDAGGLPSLWSDYEIIWCNKPMHFCIPLPTQLRVQWSITGMYGQRLFTETLVSLFQAFPSIKHRSEENRSYVSVFSMVVRGSALWCLYYLNLLGVDIMLLSMEVFKINWIVGDAAEWEFWKIFALSHHLIIL